MIGYIDSSSFPVYPYGEMMVSFSDYYIAWEPSSLSSGSFKMENSTYYFSSYSSSGGIFRFWGGEISPGAFSANSSITKIQTNALKVGYRAFFKCSSLSEITLTDCVYIGNEAFYSCWRINSLYLPKCSYIGSEAFYYNGFTSISLPECTYIDDLAFEYGNFSELYLPKC